MKNIKSVELILENCETIEIEAKYFGMFKMDDIRTGIYRIACNAISKSQTAHSIAFEIFSEANVKYAPFGSCEEQLKFHRLTQWKDITGIELKYEDGSVETYYVDYDDGEDNALGAENLNEKVHISRLGNLYIVIEKDKTIFDYFDKDEIEDVESVNFSKTMILD